MHFFKESLYSLLISGEPEKPAKCSQCVGDSLWYW